MRPRFERTHDQYAENITAETLAAAWDAVMVKEKDYKRGRAQWITTLNDGTVGVVDIHSARIDRRWHYAQKDGFHFSVAKWKRLLERHTERNPVVLAVGWTDPQYRPRWVMWLTVLPEANWSILVNAGRTRRTRDEHDSEDMYIIPVEAFTRITLRPEVEPTTNFEQSEEPEKPEEPSEGVQGDLL